MRLAAILAQWTRAIEDCVRQAQNDGSLRGDINAKAIAAFMLNSWEGAVLRAKVDRSSLPLEQFEQLVFTTLAARP